MESPSEERQKDIKKCKERRRHYAGNHGDSELCPSISPIDDLSKLSNAVTNTPSQAKRRKRSKRSTRKSCASHRIFFIKCSSSSSEEEKDHPYPSTEYFSVIHYNRLRNSLPPRPRHFNHDAIKIGRFTVQKLDENKTKETCSNSAFDLRSISFMGETEISLENKVPEFNSGQFPLGSKTFLNGMFAKSKKLFHLCQGVPELNLLLADLKEMNESAKRLSSRDILYED